jgi:hypothetical protein
MAHSVEGRYPFRLGRVLQPAPHLKLQPDENIYCKLAQNGCRKKSGAPKRPYLPDSVVFSASTPLITSLSAFTRKKRARLFDPAKAGDGLKAPVEAPERNCDSSMGILSTH